MFPFCFLLRYYHMDWSYLFRRKLAMVDKWMCLWGLHGLEVWSRTPSQFAKMHGYYARWMGSGTMCKHEEIYMRIPLNTMVYTSIRIFFINFDHYNFSRISGLGHMNAYMTRGGLIIRTSLFVSII